MDGSLGTQTVKQKMSNLEGWNAFWALFMVLIFTPAWLLSSSVEGIDWGMSAQLVGYQLSMWGYPGFMVTVMMWPVTILATVIPGSSAWLLGPLLMSMSSMPWVMLIVGGLFFFQFEMPYYRYLKDKLDPGFEARENARIIKQAFIRPRPFAGLMVFLVFFGITGEIVYGFWGRDPIADDYKGKVYLVNNKNQSFALDATLRMSMIAPGYTLDRKPGVSSRSIELVFSSKSADDVARLKRLGIPDRLFEGSKERVGYVPNLCVIKGTKVSKQHQDYTGQYQLSEASSYHYEMEKPDGPSEVSCPTNMHMFISSFNHVQFAIDRVNPQWMIVADMERDSRFGWLQRQILHFRFP